ncbi:unnamed protein product [Cuscuta campestris]|uniref:Uncharacterized protein n=1 Tax=Cuscuta campestris TaxID=132261 RepID=A0A484MFF1_9ASTE|nr:unnamed protein product [Cuscuta campestris]
MDSYDLCFESIIPETQFEDIGVDDGDFIYEKVEDEAIVIASDDDMADVAPVTERKDVVLLESQKDTVFLHGREEPNFVVLDGDIDYADWCEKMDLGLWMAAASDLTVVLRLRGVSVIAFTSMTALFLSLFPAILFLASMAMPNSNCFFAMAHMLLTIFVDTLNCAARPPGHRDEKRKRNKAECERIVEKIRKKMMEKKGE